MSSIVDRVRERRDRDREDERERLRKDQRRAEKLERERAELRTQLLLAQLREEKAAVEQEQSRAQASRGAALHERQQELRRQAARVRFSERRLPLKPPAEPPTRQRMPRAAAEQPKQPRRQPMQPVPRQQLADARQKRWERPRKRDRLALSKTWIGPKPVRIASHPVKPAARRRPGTTVQVGKRQRTAPQSETLRIPQVAGPPTPPRRPHLPLQPKRRTIGCRRPPPIRNRDERWVIDDRSQRRQDDRVVAKRPTDRAAPRRHDRTGKDNRLEWRQRYRLIAARTAERAAPRRDERAAPRRDERARPRRRRAAAASPGRWSAPAQPRAQRENWRRTGGQPGDGVERLTAIRQERRAIARQQVLQAVRAAQARATKLAQRQAELADQRQEERVASSRPVRQRLPSGNLSGSLPWLRVRGRYLTDEFDQPVFLRGVTVRWLERGEPIGSSFLPPVDDDDLAVMQSWGATVLAVPIAQDLALYGSGDAPGEAYLRALDATIAAAAQAGLYTLVQLSLLSATIPSDVDERGRERFDPPLPNEQSLTLWGSLARRYSGEPAVLFDLFRSPHDPGPADATREIVAHFGWTVWRRWLLAMLGEIRRNHPRAVTIARGLVRGRDVSGFPLAYDDGTNPANVVYAGELTVGDPEGVLNGLKRIGGARPVGIVGWRAGSQQVSAVQRLGSQFASEGWHWLAADWTESEAPLVDYQPTGLRPTALGRAFQNALARPNPGAHLDHALAQAGVGRNRLSRVEAASPAPRFGRDPFAAPGVPGNRWARFGADGPIPDGDRPKMEKALGLAYELAQRPAFAAVFARTVSKLSGKELGSDACLDALDKMVINLAETAHDKRIREQLTADAEAIKVDPLYQSPPAMSIPNGTGVWIRQWQLKRDETVIAGTLIHESAHLAGAPADALAEFALEAIHNAGYPRR